MILQIQCQEDLDLLDVQILNNEEKIVDTPEGLPSVDGMTVGQEIF